MTDAPERVWITEFTHGDRSWTDNAKIGKYRKEMEYIRADIHEAEIERLRAWTAKLEREVENERGVVDGRSRYERVAQRYRLALSARDEAEAEIERLRGLLKEAREELASQVEHEYPEQVRAAYPIMARKYKRDMDLCYRIDAALIDKEV